MAATKKELLNRTLKAANDIRAICKDAREANLLEDMRYTLDRKTDEIFSELLKQEGVSLNIQ
jgi:hypothetical protein